ncbi:MAG: hypothetical protein ACREPF_03025 [Rhodanobacteraceae bacterium]
MRSCNECDPASGELTPRQDDPGLGRYDDDDLARRVQARFRISIQEALELVRQYGEHV